MLKNLRALLETWFGSLGLEGLLEKGMATHSIVLVWRIPWTEPSRLQSMRSRGQTHRLMTDTFSFYEIVFLIVTLFSLRICFKIIRTVCSDIEKFFKYSVCDFIWKSQIVLALFWIFWLSRWELGPWVSVFGTFPGQFSCANTWELLG